MVRHSIPKKLKFPWISVMLLRTANSEQGISVLMQRWQKIKIKMLLIKSLL